MNIRVIGMVFAGLMLGGCSAADWDNATSYVGLGPDPQAAPPNTAPPAAEAAPTSPPVAQASPSNNWCQQVAKANAADAAESGFDVETQKRRAETSYKQCLGLSDPASR
jgi:ABC-type sugar transport system substrate-binding protein